MKQITLENLHCTTTEDWLGSDECRLEVYNDGELHFAYRHDLNDGEDWALGASLLFARTCVLRLFDEDGDFPGDDDDALGIVTIGAADVQHAVATFREDDADYTITYSVIDRPDIGETDLATFALDQFEASAAPSAWPGLNKADIIADLRERRWNPISINQANSNFCGPTSIVYELARWQPRRYVDLCRQLYETGGFWSRTHRVDASPGLRGTQSGQNMRPADWMLIATLRENENAVFGVSPTSTGVLSQVQGMTTPWEMEGWTSELLLKDNVANSTTFVWGEFDAIRYADQVVMGGGVAFMMIHSKIFYPPEGIVPPWPDHWVVYAGGLDEGGGRIRFHVYSWGQMYELDLTLDHFENCMFGIVTGF
ncbi:MAG: hypothetical protein IPJ61_05040 [Tessaracoccus sp.]|uniref:hypothetical protein n=1 Tax=Tessaracoccus sp. TaxID=1971211 RepID=UPI001EC04F1D|nr:hypothetical protein [Tessaracoccus sp.]MBK7820441.1 hypothetical protein [Tessaracoccus sp.]